ncbi:MAG TPA: hypothetical protein VH858_11290 [Hyphomicrobiales bacterium]|jgi:hypothetical protein
MQAGWWLEWAWAARRRAMCAYKNRRFGAWQTARLTLASLALAFTICAPCGHTPYSVLAQEMDAASKGDRLDIEPSADRWTNGGSTLGLLVIGAVGLFIGWALGMRSRPKPPAGPDKAKIKAALKDAFNDRRREANVHSLEKSIEILKAAEEAVLEAMKKLGLVD